MTKLAVRTGGRDRVLRVSGLDKAFKVYDHPFDLVKEFVFGGTHHRVAEVLNSVSIDVSRGDIVGILGRNGAGKSTLLRIVSGVLDYDAGDVEVNGKVAAILELGSGFNPEYSGRENVYFEGICMGMSPSEIRSQMDEIISFSGLSAYIDQPFKTYSSGMKARLAFSTAICVNADILVVDEALAVGDALFQKKCFERIRQIVDNGAAVLFVSHSLQQIYNVCNRAILLDRGRLIAEGEPRQVGYMYEKVLAATDAENTALGGEIQSDISVEPPPQDSGVYVKGLNVIDCQEQDVFLLKQGETYWVRSHVVFNGDASQISVGFRVESHFGQTIFGKSTFQSGDTLSGSAGDEYVVLFKFQCRFSSGDYVLGGGVSEVRGNSSRALHIIRDAQVFSVDSKGDFPGLFDAVEDVKITRLEASNE